MSRWISIAVVSAVQVAASGEDERAYLIAAVVGVEDVMAVV